ncbi:uncharacterized protein LOC106629631 [Zonotrichia albicollis]|uniref:uncharacterized protein LOC106629631 n=1 Tax=Zonotrichia albicollis TaxID=44394 RepID=UPI003D80B9BD
MLIQIDPCLFTPTCFFLSHVSLLDICCSSTIIPRSLRDVLVEKKLISFARCVTQLFSFTTWATTECHPLPGEDKLISLGYSTTAPMLSPFLYSPSNTDLRNAVRKAKLLPSCGHTRHCSPESSGLFPRLRRHRGRDMELARDNDGDWPCEAAGPSAGTLPAGTAGPVPGMQAQSRERQWRSPGSGGAGPGHRERSAAGSEGEEAKPGEEEDEEVWEDGDSGHQRLGKAQLQGEMSKTSPEGSLGPWQNSSGKGQLWASREAQ